MQLATAQRYGLAVPNTIITSDPDAVRVFAGQVGGPMLTKPLGQAGISENGELRLLYTTLISASDLVDLGAVNTTAHLFQEWISKQFDVRVTAVGDQLFAAAIHTRSERAKIDWRSDYHALNYEIIAIPEEVADGIHAYLSFFALRFGAFDFAVTEGGEWFSWNVTRMVSGPGSPMPPVSLSPTR